MSNLSGIAREWEHKCDLAKSESKQERNGCEIEAQLSLEASWRLRDLGKSSHFELYRHSYLTSHACASADAIWLSQNLCKTALCAKVRCSYAWGLVGNCGTWRKVCI